MKTTLEMPDATFRRAKARAAERGVPLRQFVTEAVEEKLKAEAELDKKPWLQLFGKLKHLRRETERINRIIEEETEKIDPEIWR